MEHKKVDPVFFLPSELVQLIFHHCSWLDQDDKGLSVPDPCLSPFLLSHVSRDWRQMALHTPGLWSRLSLEWTTRKKWSPALLGELWLSRSGVNPVVLSINERQNGYHPKNQGVNFALDYAERLSSLYLTHQHMPRSLNGTEQVFNTSNIHFPSLQHLELLKFSGSYFAHLVDAIRCPKLRKYKVDCLHALDWPLRIDSSHLIKTSRSLSSLIHLDILGISIVGNDFCIIADAFPLLVELATTLKLAAPAERTNIDRAIEFSALRCMKIKFTRGDYFEDSHNEGDVTLALLHLVTPALISLEVIHDPNFTASANHQIGRRVSNLVQRSQCSLRELALLNWACDSFSQGPEILDLITATTTLKKFSCNDSSFDRWALSQPRTHSEQSIQIFDGTSPLLLAERDAWVLLPHLTELNCQIMVAHRDSKLEEEMLTCCVDILRQRMASSFGRLRKCNVSLICSHEDIVPQTIIKSLDSLLPLGLTYKSRVINFSADLYAWVSRQTEELERELEYSFTPEEQWVAYYPQPGTTVL